MDSRPTKPRNAVTWNEAFWTWARVAALSFGGPAGQIAVMHRIIVDEKRWIGEERFLHALNYCMLLPGPEATQLAVYIGWLMHRTRGGLLAGILFVLPGFVALMGLSIIYALYQHVGIVAAVFFGLKPAVMAIVIEAVLRIGRRVLKNGVMVAIAVAAFVAIFFFETPFPLIVLAAAVVGFIGGRVAPGKFMVIKGHGGAAQEAADKETLIPDGVELPHTQPSWGRLVRVLLVGLTLWFAPLAALAAWLGTDNVFVTQGVYFSKAAMVTFGGAYAVLAYVAQDAVSKYQWISAPEMVDGLGMAETTPGPLIMVLQFVGFLAAYRQGPEASGWSPLVSGIVGATLTVWVTFVPCFIWIFAGAPYMERARQNKLLSAALSAITAAVVGCVLNLALWFSLHVLFAEPASVHYGPLRLLVPDIATLQIDAAFIAGFACVMLFALKRGMVATLAGSVALGVVMWLLRRA